LQVGDKISLLTLVKKLDHFKGKKRKGFFKCDCGKSKIIIIADVKSGQTQSCRCLHRRKVTSHGLSRSRVYRSWAMMKVRCLNKTHKDYQQWGAKGVKIHPQWMNFKNFLEGMGERPKNTSLDRFPNCLGDYEPSNCRWATAEQQSHNQPGKTDTSSKFKGVMWLKPNKKWRAVCRGKHIGLYNIEKDAAKAYDQTAYALWGDDAYLNFKEEEVTCLTDVT